MCASEMFGKIIDSKAASYVGHLLTGLLMGFMCGIVTCVLMGHYFHVNISAVHFGYSVLFSVLLSAVFKDGLSKGLKIDRELLEFFLRYYLLVGFMPSILLVLFYVCPHLWYVLVTAYLFGFVYRTTLAFLDWREWLVGDFGIYTFILRWLLPTGIAVWLLPEVIDFFESQTEANWVMYCVLILGYGLGIWHGKKMASWCFDWYWKCRIAHDHETA